MNTSDEVVVFRLASRMLEVLIQQVFMYCCIFVSSCWAYLNGVESHLFPTFLANSRKFER